MSAGQKEPFVEVSKDPKSTDTHYAAKIRGRGFLTGDGGTGFIADRIRTADPDNPWTIGEEDEPQQQFHLESIIPLGWQGSEIEFTIIVDVRRVVPGEHRPTLEQVRQGRVDAARETAEELRDIRKGLPNVSPPRRMRWARRGDLPDPH